jgi:neutral ceramidase
MKLHRILTLVFCALIITAGVLYGAEAGSLRVGAAKVDITPPASMFPMGVPTANRPAFVGVHDPLYVRTLLLDNGTSQAVIVAFDLTGVPSEETLSTKIASLLGVSTDHVWLTCTHDHSAPRVDPPEDPAAQGTPADPKTAKYREIVENNTLEAVRQAKAKLQPARMGYGTGMAYINTNRDQQVGDRNMLGYNPDGPSEKTVYVLKFESPTGEPIAFLVNYAVHPVVMFSAITKDGGVEVTGDIPGVTSRYIETHYKDKPVALWTMGAAGDQNPVYMAAFNQVMPDRTDLGAAGYALLEVQARRVGEEVLRVSDRIKADTTKVSIWAGKATPSCPGGRVTRDRKTGEVKREDAPPVELVLRALTLNDVAIVGVNGGVVSIIGQHMKKASPTPKTIFIMQMAPYVGYIPDDASYPKVTFEVTGSRMKQGCAENAIVDGLTRLVKTGLSGK